MRSRGFSAAGLFAATLLSAQTPLPQAPGATAVDISPAGGRYSEPSIAVNPNDPDQVLVVYQGGVHTQGSATAAYSTDGGLTFTIAEGTKPTNWRVAGDVTAAFDNKGHAFLCYLAFDKLGTASYWAHNAGRNGIFVRRSLDGGKTWEPEPAALKAFPTGKEANLEFEDEPRIFADNGARSRYAGNLYVGWVEWQIDKSVMLFSRSTDDGRTWSPATQISTHPGLPRDDNGSLGGFEQAITSDGTIYAIWNDGNSIVLTASRDGGKSFSRPRAILETGPIYFAEVPGVSRVEGFAQIAADAGNPGRIYVSWSDYRNGDVDVFLASSANQGRTWSRPVRVNDDPLHDGCDQFYQSMAVDPMGGDVYLFFYDRRADPENLKIKMTLARSTDGGQTFANYVWTGRAFDGQDAFLGDYTWVTAYKGQVYGAWTETAAQSEQGKTDPHGRPETVVRAGKADFSGVR